MLAMVAAANINKVQIKKYSVFIYSKAEPHAMYAIHKQTRTLCVLQYFLSSIYLDGLPSLLSVFQALQSGLRQ